MTYSSRRRLGHDAHAVLGPPRAHAALVGRVRDSLPGDARNVRPPPTGIALVSESGYELTLLRCAEIRLYIIGAPGFFSTVWDWIRGLLDPATAAKTRIVGPNDITSTLLE